MKFTPLLFLCFFGLSLSAQPFFPDLEGEALIQAIRQNFRPATVYSYNVARDTLYGKIDRVNDSLYCVYTGFGIAMNPNADPSSDAFSKGINTEHTWPRSRGAKFGNALSDMHHLFPSREDVNSDRGSLPFGEISDNSTESWYYLQFQRETPPSAAIRDLYSEILPSVRFEPREDHKGNVARAMFYFYTVYRAEADATAPDYFPPQINDLCDWHSLDPVDARELERTEQIALRQDNKVNPFVVDCNLLMRAYCPDLVPLSCLSSVDDILSPEKPFEVLGVGRTASGQQYLMLSTDEQIQLEIDWFDMLGRKVSFEARDWLSPGTFQLLLSNEVASTNSSGNAPYTARLRVRSSDGNMYIKSVLVP